MIKVKNGDILSLQCDRIFNMISKELQNKYLTNDDRIEFFNALGSNIQKILSTYNSYGTTLIINKGKRFYRIVVFENEIWIENEENEGMGEIKDGKFFDMIDKFFKENF